MSKSSRARGWALALAAATALSAPAAAADRAADASGAKAIADFLEAYAGKAALPSIKVTQQANGYRVSFDFATATAAFRRPGGMTYEPVEIAFDVVQQDDGQWRVESGTPPPIVGHMASPTSGGPAMDVRVETSGVRNTFLIDPALGWFSSGNGRIDKMSFVERGPGVEEFFEIGDIKADAKTTKGPNGLTTLIAEPVGTVNFVLDVDPKGVDPRTGGPRKPVHASAQGHGGRIDVALSDFRPEPLTDAWKFSAAHPEKADIARDFEALKPILTALAADHMRLNESIKLDKLDVLTESGTFAFEGAAVELGVANAGLDSGVSERFSAQSLKLPDSLAPPTYAALLPTSFEFGFKATGFDIEGALQEWLADAKPGPDGVEISDEDRTKVMKRLSNSRPVVVEIASSQFTGPSLDVKIVGKVTIENQQPTGTLTLTMKDFDKNAEAIERADPQMAQQLTPVLAMAKGLGKPGPDGALVWVCTLGPDKVVKVNGMPMGKAPF